MYTREEHRGRFELGTQGRFELCTRGRNTEGDPSSVHERETQRKIRVVYRMDEHRGRFELCTRGRNTEGDLSIILYNLKEKCSVYD